MNRAFDPKVNYQSNSGSQRQPEPKPKPGFRARRQSQPEENQMLAALTPDLQRRLFPHLELVPLSLRTELYGSGSPLRHVYFPTDSIISLQYLLTDGGSTAISVVGNEGLLGITIFLGFETPQCRAVVQSAGYAFRLPKANFQTEIRRNGELQALMLRYTQALLSQVSQTAICNRHHCIDQQLCRWLLLSLDRLPHNHVTMTQEFIANMLGVRREGVTAAATKLRKAGIISY
ncbi:MAG: helix-turn-helix domain-containing protein, partial [Haliea sp.]